MPALLLRHGLRLWWLGLTRGSTAQRRAMTLVVVPLVSTVVFVALFFASYAFFTLLLTDDPASASSYLAAGFAGVMVFVLLGGISATVHRLYLASDLTLLLAAPIRLRDLFVLKFVETALRGMLAGLAGFATLLGYAAAAAASPFVYVAALLLMVLAVVLASAGALGLTIAVVRFVPAQRVQAVLVVGGTVFGVLAWLAFQMGGGRLGVATGRFAPLLDRGLAHAAWLPSAWAADTLLAVQHADPAALIRSALLLCMATIAIGGGAYALFARTVYEGQGRLREVRAARPGRVWRDSGPGRLLRPFPPPMRAIIAHEWRAIARDIRLVAGIIFPLVMAVVFSYQIFGGERQIGWVVLGGVPFVLFIWGSGLPATTFGREGKNFALLRSAPVEAATLIAAKFVAHAAPVVVVLCVLVLGAAVWGGASLAATVAWLAATAWLAAGAILADVAAGAVAPNFDADNPQQSVTCAGYLLASVVSGLFLVASGGLFAWLEYRASAFGSVVDLVVTIVLIGVVAGAVAVIGLTLRSGARTLDAWQAE